MLLKSGFDLTVGPITYQNLNGVKVFGFGKASLSMATEVADILGGGAILPGSTLSAPFSATSGPTPPRGFEVYSGARNFGLKLSGMRLMRSEMESWMI